MFTGETYKRKINPLDLIIGAQLSLDDANFRQMMEGVIAIFNPEIFSIQMQVRPQDLKDWAEGKNLPPQSLRQLVVSRLRILLEKWRVE